MKIFVVGSLNMDLVIKAPFMPNNGVTISGEGFMTNPGGKGANQAVAVGKLGGDSYMVGCVGKEFGDELISTLQTYGVHTEYVEKQETVSSGIAVIVVVDGDNRIILDKGANGKIGKELIDRALENAQEGDYLIVQLEIELSMVKYALQKAKEKAMITVFNPAPATKLTTDFFTLCDYFIPNQSETEFYTGIYPSDEDKAKECALRLMNMGVKNVVITMGAEGSIFISSEKQHKADSFKVEAIDTTAAGDTFVGGLVTALSEGKEMEEAMRFASKASSITVIRRGAQKSIPYRSEIE